MKTNKLNIALAAVVVLLSTACSSNFLDRYPAGGSILQNTYEQLDNKLEGSMRGVYALMYQSGGSGSHDWFSRRSIDMYEDFLSGDMAMKNCSYGWFRTDERGEGIQYRSSQMWSYYYRMLHNTNMVIRLIAEDPDLDLINKINQFGLDNDSIYTESEITAAHYYAQALTMRGYVLANLVRIYTPEVGSYQAGAQSSFDGFATCPPVYTEENMDEPQGYSKGAQIYGQAEKDLTRAIQLFEHWQAKDEFARDSKIAADLNVARGVLAYMYLNRLNYAGALNHAKEVIESGSYTVLPNNQLTTTGFNNVNSESWIWGQQVTAETSTGLASFWGHVDIHCYSYAWIGDTKVIDQMLYDSIPSWDGRKEWFNDGKASPVYKLCPDGKFYSAKNPTSTKDRDIDREWINDNVYMRIEMMYLIAAEASFRLGNTADAINYLNAITDQRLLLSSNTAATEYAAYQTLIANNSQELLKAIIYNWRIELWGEGYSYQTFRRLVKQKKLGGNHYNPKEIKQDDDEHNYFRIPGGELYYNPKIGMNEDQVGISRPADFKHKI